MQLDNAVLADPSEMRLALGHIDVAPGLHRLPFGFIEFLADAEMESSRYDRHVLIIGMHMRCYFRTLGELDADHVAFGVRKRAGPAKFLLPMDRYSGGGPECSSEPALA